MGPIPCHQGKGQGGIGRPGTAHGPDRPGKGQDHAAHPEILADPAMDDEIRGLVMEQLCSPDAAIAQIYDTYAAIWQNPKTPYTGTGFRPTGCEAPAPPLLGRPLQSRTFPPLAKPVIVVADDLFPSDTASLDLARVLASSPRWGAVPPIRPSSPAVTRSRQCWE